MTKLGEIWCVSAGEYSDYRVLAVCEDEETAERWAAQLRKDGGWERDAAVERLPLIPRGAEPKITTTWRYIIHLLDDGRTGHEYVVSDTSYFTAPARRPAVHMQRTGEGGTITVCGPSEEAVRKVAGERIAKWTALEDKRMFWPFAPEAR